MMIIIWMTMVRQFSQMSMENIQLNQKKWLYGLKFLKKDMLILIDWAFKDNLEVGYLH